MKKSAFVNDCMIQRPIGASDGPSRIEDSETSYRAMHDEESRTAPASLLQKTYRRKNNNSGPQDLKQFLSGSTLDDATSIGTGTQYTDGETHEGRTYDGTMGSETLKSMDSGLESEHSDFLRTKQDVAYCVLVLIGFQLLLVILQLCVCGMAPFDVNPMMGPFPDVFSEWGGKNTFLILEYHEWWRLITPAFLHVGLIHLFVNVFCQLGTIALFEREWGSLRWSLIYLVSAFGSVAFSARFDPDTVSVASSGPLMGLYAAKLAQVMIHTCFRVDSLNIDDVVRLEQLCGVVAGLGLVSLMSALTYIDWSGHVGGLVTGFSSAMFLFCRPISSCCIRFFWASLGLFVLGGSLAWLLYDLFTSVTPDEELEDTCQYFRHIFSEDYMCGCLA